MSYSLLNGYGVSQEVFLHDETLGGVTYRVVGETHRSPTKGGLVNWEVRDYQALGHGEETPVAEGTEVARMTPYVESTGPRDPGDGFRWVDNRVTLGRGIIIVPPADWSPDGRGGGFMDSTTGELTAISTTDFSQVRQHATTGQRGFVLYPPADGWQNVNGNGTKPPKPKTTAFLVAAGLIVVGFVVLKISDPWEKEMRAQKRARRRT